ncbi:MAG TPA: formate dehydrogenase accessory sulfurtransferase FdhD [Opitutaceae bacterium]
MASRPTRSAKIRTVRKGRIAGARADRLAVEEPLEIRVEGKGVAVVMRTPGDDDDLVSGFLLTEGVVREPTDIFEITHCRSADDRSREGNVVDVLLHKPETVNFEALTRHVFSATSCGLCGKASIDAVHQSFAPLRARFRIDARVLHSLPGALAKTQAAFRETGGLHAAALFDAEGTLLVAREDVGRHNAVDKVLGHALRKGWLPLDRHMLFVSGRTSFEIVQKALAARVPVVAGISAPSSLAVQFARANKQGLAGFVRDDRFNIYAGASRFAAR